MSVTTLTALEVVPILSKHSVVQIVAICSPNSRNLRPCDGFLSVRSCFLSCSFGTLQVGSSSAGKWDASRFTS
jgi:hypothetical protein